MSSLAQLSFWLAILFASVSAQGTFIQPPQPGTTGDFSNDPTYRIGENMTVKWDSNLQSMDLRLFQQYPLADGAWQYTNIELATNDTIANWTVSLDNLITDIQDGEDAVLFFVVTQAGKSQWNADSHYFNVSVNATTKTATPTTTLTMATSSLPSTTQTQQSTPTPTRSVTSAPNARSHGLSKGAIAGIAVAAIIVGILLVIGGLTFLGRKHSRENGDQKNLLAIFAGAKMDKTGTGHPEGVHEVPVHNQDPTHEMAASPQERIYEAP